MRRQCVINGGGRRVLWVGLTVGGTDVVGCWCRVGLTWLGVGVGSGTQGV